MTEQESFKKWVVKEIVSGSVSRRTIMLRLTDSGFKFFNSGGYKAAYLHPEHPKYIVKVYLDGADETEDCPDTVPADVGKYYLHPIYRTDNFMIQLFANDVGGNGVAAYKWFLENTKLDKYDLHDGNCRYHNKKPVIIDFCS